MTMRANGVDDRLLRELDQSRRECRELGARLLRLQEEQANFARDAWRSRNLARLSRDAHRLADLLSSADELGGALLAAIRDAAGCDRAALLAETRPGSGDFAIAHAVGLGEGTLPPVACIADAPEFFFTTPDTRLDPPAADLLGVLRCPHLLWACDPASGRALVLGNLAGRDGVRWFEAADRDLVEGALGVFLDVLARQQAELQQRRAQQMAEQTAGAMAAFLDSAGAAMRVPLNAIIGCSEKMATGSRYPLTLADCAEFADRIHESGNRVAALLADVLEHADIVRTTLAQDPDWQRLGMLVNAAVEAGAAAAEARRVLLDSEMAAGEIEVQVDRAGFGLALARLVGNAVRGCPVGGRVKIAARRLPDGTAEIVLRRAAAAGDLDDAAGLEEAGLPLLRALLEGQDGRMTLPGETRWEMLATIVLPSHRVRTAAAANAVDLPEDGATAA